VITAYLALGSNLGDRVANLRAALDGLAGGFELLAVSRCYETEPAYVLEQPRFYNLACRTATRLAPLEALRFLKALETTIGRVPSQRFGPRAIDLDLLLYGAEVLNLPDLVVPHPRLHERPFVLVPLAEVAPEVLHPVLGQTMVALRDALGDTTRQVWPAAECDRGLEAAS
jgi:2-amino-4-hydroxy-6-hydroxymethyldihydropteridine diphosphokinase